MSVGYRGGSTDDVWSILRQTIEAGLAAAAFVVTKMRPPLVAAQTTLVSEGEGVLIELVQAPQPVIDAFEALAPEVPEDPGAKESG